MQASHANFFALKCTLKAYCRWILHGTASSSIKLAGFCTKATGTVRMLLLLLKLNVVFPTQFPTRAPLTVTKSK